MRILMCNVASGVRRCLRNVMNRDMSVTVFGQTFQMPIGLSPTARQKRWTSDGEVATVRGEILFKMLSETA